MTNSATIVSAVKHLQVRGGGDRPPVKVTPPPASIGEAALAYIV